VSVTFTTESWNGATCRHLEGVIDEKLDGLSLFEGLDSISVLDLAGIQRVTSFGVRRWSEAVASIPSDVRQLYLVRCPPCIVDQFNMVLNFGGRAEVLSVSANGYCEKCGDDRLVPVAIFGADPHKQLARSLCPDCKSPLQLEQE